MDIPAEGYPFSAEAVVAWFRDRHGRTPGDAELNAVLNAMAARDATPPRDGPDAAPEGWRTPPSAANSTGQG
jgi:hypothetical protein